ncbi:hypothetical protein GCM10010236_07780 [Streptomyces eurythermus]|nr:hypothetical protein GCM10010236_07780 [Streptomyces eurythermus]
MAASIVFCFGWSVGAVVTAPLAQEEERQSDGCTMYAETLDRPVHAIHTLRRAPLSRAGRPGRPMPAHK